MQNRMRKVIVIQAIVSTVFGILSGICAFSYVADFAILYFLRPFGVQFSFIETLKLPITQQSFFIQNAILLAFGLLAFLSGLLLTLKIKNSQENKKEKLCAMIGQIGGMLSLGASAGYIFLWVIIGTAFWFSG
jgi:hypothetical protein